MNFIGGTDFYSDDDTLYGGGDSQFDEYESSHYGGGESIGSLDDHLMYGGTSDKINNLFRTSLFETEFDRIEKTINTYVQNIVNNFTAGMEKSPQYKAFDTFVTKKFSIIKDASKNREDIMKLAVMCYIFTHKVDVTNLDDMKEIEVDFSNKKNEESINISGIDDTVNAGDISIEDILEKLNNQLNPQNNVD